MSEEKYLSEIEDIYDSIQELDTDYQEQRAELKDQLAEKIEEGRFEADITVAQVADRLDVKRQTVNNFLIAKYGVRHPDKAKAGKLGHVNRG